MKLCCTCVAGAVKKSGFPQALDKKIEKMMRKWFANRCKGSGYKPGKKSKKMKAAINDMPVGAAAADEPTDNGTDEDTSSDE